MGIRFNPVQSKYIFQQLLSVLDYMHEKRYVHRDLKSSNILVDQRYRVKLADFGLARSIDDE
jgi:serine/threonine protein kinase